MIIQKHNKFGDKNFKQEIDFFFILEGTLMVFFFVLNKMQVNFTVPKR